MVGCQEGHQDDKNLCHLSTEVLLELKNEIIGTACQSWLTKDVTIRPCLCEAKCLCACVCVALLTVDNCQKSFVCLIVPYDVLIKILSIFGILVVFGQVA